MFFKNLFDFDFKTFVTRQVASFVYAALLALVSVTTVVAVVVGLYSLVAGIMRPESAIFLLIGTPVVALLTLVILRVAFESSIALVMIAENTKCQNN